jgi:hypothetical protein
MDFYWIYDIPNWIFALICVGTIITFAVTGLFAMRGFIVRNAMEDHNEMLSAFMSGLGALYGITLGLIAVGVWESFDKVKDIVSNEASVVMSVYNDVRRFPEPHRGALVAQLKNYTQYTIKEAWPEQRQGKISKLGIERLQNFYRTLLNFEPSNTSQEILLDGAMKNSNQLLTLLEGRLDRVKDGLPSAVWYVIFFGALVNIMITWCFNADKFKVYVLGVVLYSGMLGSLIFLIAAMDNPFRGEFSVSPEAFETVLQYIK